MSEEIWKPTYLTEKYEISNLGRVKTVKTGVIRKLHTGNRGYNTVVLKFDKKQYNVNIHRLVMEAFKPEEKFEGSFINHIDGNKLNNSLENLEWCTHKENMAHAKEKGLVAKGEDTGTAKLTESDVIVIRQYYNDGLTQTLLAKIFNVDQSLISLVVSNKLWTHLDWTPRPPKDKRMIDPIVLKLLSNYVNQHKRKLQYD